MVLKECQCYTIIKEFKVNEETFKRGEEIELFSTDGGIVYFGKKHIENPYRTPSMPIEQLEPLVDPLSGYPYFGTCEHCEKDLSYEPDGSWGVGYVCKSCAHHLRGEYE